MKNKNTKTLKKILEFISLIEKIKYTTRHNWSSKGRQESVAEHTWRTCVLFILMNEQFDLDVDPYRMLKMLLIHDIHELVDGDIPAFIKERSAEDHHLTEMEAIKHVYSNLPEDTRDEFTDLAEEFEQGESRDAVIARLFDRIESQFQHLNSGIDYWSDEEVGEHMLNYPNKYLEKFDNDEVVELWKLIKKDLKQMTKEYYKKDDNKEK